MFKNRKGFFIAAALALVLALAGFSTPAYAGVLMDVQEASWAEQAIEEMYAAGIVTGYEDGTFKPYNGVTRLEAVAMLVRAVGMEEQARAKENAKVSYRMPPGLFWGRGYLIVGVELGMLNKDYLDQLQPASPASRVEVAMLAYHALDLSPDSSPLTFDDAGQIPAEYREGVAAVVKNGLMKGLPGNVFKPADGINRAQMAVLLSNIAKFRPSEAYQARLVGGTLSQIDPAAGVISVQDGVNRLLAANCAVFVDGRRALPADLKAGDQVKMLLDGSGQVAYIEAAGAGAVQTYRGRVNSLFAISGEYWLGLTGFDGISITRPVMSGVTVNESGTQKDVSSLSQGNCVEIKLVDDKITEINMLKTSTITGRVEAVHTSSLSLRDDSGLLTEMNVTGDVDVKMGDIAMTFGEVQEGDRVRVTVCENMITGIEILHLNSVEGEIEELDTRGTWGITIRDGDGDVEEYEVDEDVVVKRDGDEIDFDELDEGEWVKLELDDDDCVIYIEVDEDEDSSEVEGEIEELDTRGTWGITIRDEDGDVEEYEVDEDVVVKRDGDEIDFDELDEGEWVRLELDDDDIVVQIEVTDEDSLTVTGTVTGLDTGSSPEITIKKSSGSEVSYDISDDVDCIRDGDSIDLDEIVIGAEVEVRVRDGEADRIEVLNDEDITVEGEITDVSTSRGRIRIVQDNGNEFTYYLADGCKLYDEDGDRIDLDEVEEGWDVEIRLEDGEIKRLYQR
ncbi:hypothetical membrane protein [Pelotomaculum thermopropionicum SI]|uniref:Hypothetical membrane protein n=1 Tax=Pelotomaculum thermopropionicum (strain DSM 13744 / JCM 10971 / SI) TaxID=370438 RepID=A5CYX8_PELTS|nr:hypothetical membrane protein [Pelotomaculum thermopropionicum SI]